MRRRRVARFQRGVGVVGMAVGLLLQILRGRGLPAQGAYPAGLSETQIASLR